MKRLKNSFYSLVIVLLGFLSANAQNLFKNGDFKNGTKGWQLTSFKLKNDGNYSYVATGSYIMPGMMPSIKTDDSQKIHIIKGKTYIVSFWAQGLDKDIVMADCMFTDSDGEEDDDAENVKGLEDFNVIHFEVVDKREDGWMKFQKELTFTKKSEVKDMTSFEITLSTDYGPSELKNKKISEISFELKKPKPKILPPADFSVASEKLTQRDAQFTWKAIDGKTYKIDIDGNTYEVAKGANTFYVGNLLPNTEYTAQIYTTANPNLKSNVKFTTKDYIEPKEENRVPFLDNIDETESIPQSFTYHISDLTGGKVSNVEIRFNNVPATIKDNMVTIPSEVGTKGELVLKITQENNETTTLTYDSITIKNK